MFMVQPYGALESPWTAKAADALSAADSYQQSGDWNMAITQYRRTLQISPMPPAFQSYVIYNNIGWSMYHLGDWAGAEENYMSALRASPQPPPTDHAYINLATLHKAENRIKPTIKAYRAAVALTHQSPTWAQLGWALMQDFKLDEATQTLHDALAYRGDDAPAAQECHNYLGTLYASKRTWSLASQHFVRAIDLGLPTNATGCRAGRWQLAEGWANAKGVSSHPLSLESVLGAIDGATHQVQQRAPRSAAAPALCSRMDATATFEDKFAGSNYSNGKEQGDYKLVELHDVYLDGKHPSSLYQMAPECRYFTGEHTASAFMPWDFGVLDREQNGSYNRQQPFEVREMSVGEPAFGVFDLRGGANAFWHYQMELVTKLILLLKLVLEPHGALSPSLAAENGAQPVAWDKVRLFIPATLGPIVDVLRKARLFTEKDGSHLRVLQEPSLIRWSWQPGARVHFSRLFLVDVAPPLHETAKASYRMLKLNLRATRQRWRIYDTPLYNLHFPRRPALLLQRCVLAAAMPSVPFAAVASEGRHSEVWATPRILYYSRSDGQGKRAVKGEKRLLEQLEATFGVGAVQVFSGGSMPDLRRAARQFSSAQVVLGPHGAGLANLIFSEPSTPVFLLPTYDGRNDEAHVFELGSAAVVSKPTKPSGHTKGRNKPNGGAIEGSGTSAIDAYFSYLAGALGLRLYVLPYAKAHFWGNYSVPPDVARIMVAHIKHLMIETGVWRPGNEDHAALRHGIEAAPFESQRQLMGKPRPFHVYLPPPPPAHPPRVWPSRGPLPAPPSSVLPFVPPHPRVQHPALPLPIFGKGLAGAFDTIEQPFGRGFRMVLPDAIDASTPAQAAASWPPASARPVAREKVSLSSPPSVPQEPRRPAPPNTPAPALRDPRLPPELFMEKVAVGQQEVQGGAGVLSNVTPSAKGHQGSVSNRVFGSGEDTMTFRTWCPSWVQLHECEVNPNFMLQHCARSCGIVARLEHSIAQLLARNSRELQLSAAEIAAVYALNADSHGEALSIVSDLQAQWVSSEGGMTNVRTGKRLYVAPFQRVPAIDSEAALEGVAEDNRQGEYTEDTIKSLRFDRDGPLTVEQMAYAWELAVELAPLFKRMASDEQEMVLSKFNPFPPPENADASVPRV